MDTGALNQAWARGLVGAMIAAGLRHACISPGSRSTPLTLALAERSELSRTVHIDERSAAFFAVGYARATGWPALLVCTSGTAGANYLPALVEAYQDRLPVIALTADRPPELRDSGAWQTIDQIKLFGGVTRWFCELSPPHEDPLSLRYVHAVGRRAVQASMAPIPGPVHCNAPFREPLVPGRSAEVAEGVAVRPPLDASSVATTRTAPSDLEIDPLPGLPMADTETLDRLAVRITRAPRGLILAGRLSPLELRPAAGAVIDGRSEAERWESVRADYAAALTALAEASGYPILAEPAGGLRYGRHDRSQVLCGYEAVLRHAGWCQRHPPQLVLRFGASFTWKQVAGFLSISPETEQIIVDPLHRWDDPTRSGGRRLAVDPTALAGDLSRRLGRMRGGRAEGSDAWRTSWIEAASRARQIADAISTSEQARGTVAWVYPALIEALPAGGLIFAANSMAVRDLDSFTASCDKPLRAMANRGAAGIDGTLSSALGAALGSGRPSLLVTGDLAFLHDLNGLGAAGADGAALQVVVLNDEGGGIFEHLSIAEGEGVAEVFDRYFRTPPRADLAAACRTYGRPHRLVATPGELIDSLVAGWSRGGLGIIEIALDMAKNTGLHRELWHRVGRMLDDRA